MIDIITEDKKAAVNWLRTIASDIAPMDHGMKMARIALRLLAMPRLPEEPTEGMLEAMRRAYAYREQIAPMYRALYNHLKQEVTMDTPYRVEREVNWPLTGWVIMTSADGIVARCENANVAYQIVDAMNASVKRGSAGNPST